MCSVLLLLLSLRNSAQHTKQEALQGERAKTVHINLTVFGLTQPGVVAQFASLEASVRTITSPIRFVSTMLWGQKWRKNGSNKSTPWHMYLIQSSVSIDYIYLACYHGFLIFHHIYLMLDFYFISKKIQKSRMKKKRKERKS